MILNEYNQQEIAPKLKDGLQKKKVNPSYNRNMKMMDEDKLLAYVNTAISLGAIEYAPILKALRSEIQSRINGTATKPAVSVNMLNRLINLIDDRLLASKIDLKQNAKDFEASKEYGVLRTKYARLFDNLFSQCSALNIQDGSGVKELSVDNSNKNMLKSALGYIDRNFLKEAGLGDSVKNMPDLVNVNKVLNNLYENIYKIRYVGLTLILKFLDSAVKHSALNARDVKLYEGIPDIFAGIEYLRNDQSYERMVVRGKDGDGFAEKKLVKDFCLNALNEFQIGGSDPSKMIELELDNVKKFYDEILKNKDRVLGN